MSHPALAKRSAAELEQTIQTLFGSQAHSEPLAAPDEMGRRVHGVDLKEPLLPAQAEFMVTLLDHFSVLSFPDQGDDDFSLRYLERLANHFGAPIPHPTNYANYLEHKKTGAPLQLQPPERQAANLCDLAFPHQIKCVDGADSPAVLVVGNLPGSGSDKDEQYGCSLHWHTDIEFEPVPLSTSMFYVQCAPIARRPDTGNWILDVPPAEGFYHPDSGATLTARRLAMPLNGETAYADTVRAFADLPLQEQAKLEQTMVRRRVRKADAGWLAPLVYVNPRTGTKSLHSPIWASRGKNIAPVEVDGLSDHDSRLFLDKLESHVLQPKYRYDHQHRAGDITIWSNFSTLHNAPPSKSVINVPADARLMYRISSKGEPCHTLPRADTDAWIQANISPPYRTPQS